MLKTVGIDFHWNAALTTINVAKIQHAKDENFAKENFSMENSKTLYSVWLKTPIFRNQSEKL